MTTEEHEHILFLCKKMGERMADVVDQMIVKHLDRLDARSPEECAEEDRLWEERKERIASLTSQEKWNQMTNPTNFDSYGLSMPWKEICAVPEARKEVESWIPLSAIITHKENP